MDLLVAHTIAFMQETVGENCMDAFPNLIALKDRVYEIPQIKYWMATRPKPDLRMLKVLPVSV